MCLHAYFPAGFYLVFHLCTNFSAELLRCADRRFYEAWWSASSFSEFWRRWNIPVHSFCHHYLYVPCRLDLKWSKNASISLVFLVSALLHEYLFSIPFASLQPWSFLGIAMQAPLVLVLQCMAPNRHGALPGLNLAMWLLLLAGVPLVCLGYSLHSPHFYQAL